MERASSQSVTSPEALFSRLSQGERSQIVDVREPGEYRFERIAGSVLVPLSELEKQVGQIDRHRSAYLFCQTGLRARRAAERLAKLGVDDTVVVDGGLQGWATAGYPLERSGVWPMERQVRFTAGLLVLSGIALAYTVNANWICLSIFVALGMVFSAVTNSCGMGTVLMRMPWNRVSCSAERSEAQAEQGRK